MQKKLLVLLIMFAVLFIGYGMLGKDEPNPGKSTIRNTKNAANLDTTIQAWIYPGPPSCRAMQEIQDGRKIDVLKPEYFKISETGDLVFLTEENEGCNAFSEQNLQLVKENSQAQYITVASNHIDMRVLFKSPEKLNTAINTLVDFAVENDVDGIEIDFEEFSAWTRTDYADYKNFLMQLGNALHKNDKKLMLDGPPLTQEMQQYYLWQYSDFEDMPVDYLVIMAYDYQYDHGSGSPIAPTEWVNEVVEYAKGQISDHKRLVIGIPSYGYSATGDFKFRLNTKEETLKTSGMESAKEDPSSFEMFLQRDGVFYVYQTKEGLQKKIENIKNQGIKHISVWHLGGNDWFE